MVNMKKTKYDKLEIKFIEIGQELLDNFGINKEDLKDIINDQLE